MPLLLLSGLEGTRILHFHLCLCTGAKSIEKCSSTAGFSIVLVIVSFCLKIRTLNAHIGIIVVVLNGNVQNVLTSIFMFKIYIEY